MSETYAINKIRGGSMKLCESRNATWMPLNHGFLVLPILSLFSSLFAIIFLTVYYYTNYIIKRNETYLQTAGSDVERPSAREDDGGEDERCSSSDEPILYRGHVTLTRKGSSRVDRNQVRETLPSTRELPFRVSVT